MDRAPKRVKDWIESVRGKIKGIERRPYYPPVPAVDYAMMHEEALRPTELPVEYVYIMEIPEKELDAMLELRDWYDRNLNGFDITKLDEIVREYYHEKQLREEDPRLKELYEKYETMLALITHRKFRLK